MEHELDRKAVLAALQSDERETAARYEVSSALQNSLVGQTVQARAHVASAMKLSHGRDVQAGAALALAFLDDTCKSQRLMNDPSKRFPENTVVQFNYLPAIRGQFAFENGKFGNAIAATDPAAFYELCDPEDGAITPALYPVYVRGQAYLNLRDGPKQQLSSKKFSNIPALYKTESSAL